MIRLSRLTDYAVVVLESLNRGDSCASAATLARASNLPEPTVSKILKLLSRSGIVAAQRGASGGYSLQITLADLPLLRVIEAIEGPLSIADCVETETHNGKGVCTLEGTCTMSGRWTMVNRAVKTALNSITLAQLVAPRCALHAITARDAHG